MVNNEFNQMINKFTKIPGQIDAATPAEFENQFRELLDTKEARLNNGVVYLWLSERPVPRLMGECRVIYIGKTDKSIRDRHYKYAKKESEGNNWLRYNYIITNFGSMTFMVAPCGEFASNPKDAEVELLKSYFIAHLEAPPINRQMSLNY
jgi:hypothetical protein